MQKPRKNCHYSNWFRVRRKSHGVVQHCGWPSALAPLASYQQAWNGLQLPVFTTGSAVHFPTVQMWEPCSLLVHHSTNRFNDFLFTSSPLCIPPPQHQHAVLSVCQLTAPPHHQQVQLGSTTSCLPAHRCASLHHKTNMQCFLFVSSPLYSFPVTSPAI